MSTTIIETVNQRTIFRYDWLNHLFRQHKLLTRIIVNVITLLCLTASSEILFYDKQCPSNLICIVVSQLGDNEESLSPQVATILTKQLQQLLQTIDRKQVVVENSTILINPDNSDVVQSQANELAQQTGAQFVLWGGLIEEQLYIELSSFSDVGESPKIRPARVHTFFKDQIYIRIPCDPCNTYDENIVQHLQTLSYIVTGWAYYLKDSPEQASQAFLAALMCSGEQFDPRLIPDTMLQCLNKHPIDNLVPLYYYTGKSFALQGDYPNAIYFLRKASQLAPREPSIRIGIGQAYQNWLLEPQAPVLEELGLARELLYQMQQQADSEQQAWIEYDLGIIAELLGNYDTAEANFQKALDYLGNEQKSYEILLGLARVQQQIGELEAEQSTLNHATKVDPGSPWAYLALAQLASGDQEQKQIALRRAQAVTPDEPLVDVTQAELCKSWQDYACATIAYQTALEKRPDWGWLHSKVGEFYLPSVPTLPYQSWERANFHFDLVADTLRPNDPWAHERLAYVLLKQKKYDEAVIHYHRAIELANPDFIPSRLYCNLSSAQEQQGAISDANQSRELCTNKDSTSTSDDNSS